jgi:transmembrane sensor
MDVTAAKTLLQRYLEGDASQEEIIIIEEWYQQLVHAGEWHWTEDERQALEAKMEAHLLGHIDREDAGRTERARVLPIRRLLGAAVVVAVIAAAYLLIMRRPAAIAPVAVRYRNDARPGRNAALLTLSGGKTVLLDDSAPKNIGRQGNAVILNDSGGLVYQAGTGQASEIFYNTLTTQKGNQYHLTLPDGTGVWLNALSSITYPTAFTGKERRVSISGEAYFEVAKNQQLPFVVQQAGMTVEVLGTSFDVNGYGDDLAQRATLVEGKIRVGKEGAVSVLEPGQQAVLGKTGNSIIVDHDPDIEAVLAWKNGSFVFNYTDIGAIMQQVQRWYDVEVIYESNINKHFVADIPRNVPLSQLLQLLEGTGQVHFRIEGKKVFVMP